MDDLRILKPNYNRFIHLKQLGFSVDRYTARDLEGLPSDLNLPEIKEELKKLDSTHYLPTLLEVTRAFEALKHTHPAASLNMMSTRWIRTDDVIIWPDANWYYRNIEPEVERGRHPVLVQKADFENKAGELIIRDGERTEVPDFPRAQGIIRVDIEELGIKKGTYVFTRPHKHREEENYGLRGIFFSNYTPPLKRKCVSAIFPPWVKNENIEFYIFSKRTKEPNLEDYIERPNPSLLEPLGQE